MSKTRIIVKQTYEEIVKFAKDNNCNVITTKEEYENLIGKKKEISMLSSCGHKQTFVGINDLFFRNKGIICKNCIILKNKYNLLVELCISNGCKIITTEKEYFDMIKRGKINIISKCGHNSNDILIDGLKKTQYILCKDCVSTNRKKFNNNNSSFNTMQIEADSIKIIKEKLTSIILEKTVEGCKADLIIKPNKIKENKWLSIQVKATIKKNIENNYIFSFKKNNYENNYYYMCCN
jgi:hypothetical protein